ncbi:MAG: helix-turn-helix domain-containing protein, partial [Clostridia bacterium]
VNCAATLLVIEAIEAARGGTQRNAAAESIRSWIEANVSKKLTVGKIAERFGYSPDYISQLMKELTGYTVKNYITYLRLDRAKELLLSTDMNIKQISSICGCGDYKQFLKLFRKHTGLTPKNYRSVYRHNMINTV